MAEHHLRVLVEDGAISAPMRSTSAPEVRTSPCQPTTTRPELTCRMVTSRGVQRSGS